MVRAVPIVRDGNSKDVIAARPLADIVEPVNVDRLAVKFRRRINDLRRAIEGVKSTATVTLSKASVTWGNCGAGVLACRS